MGAGRWKEGRGAVRSNFGRLWRGLRLRAVGYCVGMSQNPGTLGREAERTKDSRSWSTSVHENAGLLCAFLAAIIKRVKGVRAVLAVVRLVRALQWRAHITSLKRSRKPAQRLLVFGARARHECGGRLPSVVTLFLRMPLLDSPTRKQVCFPKEYGTRTRLSNRNAVKALSALRLLLPT
jgi:hypothetical protein